MYLNAHCRAIFMSDLDSWDSVDAKNGLTHLDWTTDTRDTKCVLKWVLVRIAAFCCAHGPQIWIPETEYYQKVASHAQIRPQGAEKPLSKVNVVWWGLGCGMRWLPWQPDWDSVAFAYLLGVVKVDLVIVVLKRWWSEDSHQEIQ